MLRNILMVFMCLIIFSSHCYAVQDVRESIVKIYCVGSVKNPLPAL